LLSANTSETVNMGFVMWGCGCMCGFCNVRVFWLLFGCLVVCVLVFTGLFYFFFYVYIFLLVTGVRTTATEFAVNNNNSNNNKKKNRVNKRKS